MRVLLFATGLLLSSSIFAESQRIYAGAGSVYEDIDPVDNPRGEESRYLVSMQLGDGDGEKGALITFTVIHEDREPHIRVLRVRKAGSDAYEILDEKDDVRGWAYQMEFEDHDSLKVHGLMLNYRTDDDHSVAHFLRFTRANGIVFSTGSAVDRQGKVVSVWYEKMQQVYRSDRSPK